MKQHATKKIKNSTLVIIFFFVVLFAIVISLFVKIGVLITESRFDIVHQFITEVKDGKGNEELIAFNPGLQTIGILQVHNVKRPSDIQELQIPIDAQVQLSDISQDPSTLFFSTIFHCYSPICIHMNAVDAGKLYWFSNHIQADSITSQTISLPGDSATINQIIPEIFTDDTLYKEAASISIINASGQSGLGNELGKLLTNIGANVISITTGDTQTMTTITTSSTNSSYTTQRLEQILHIPILYQKNSGISDIVITIGEKHPQL